MDWLNHQPPFVDFFTRKLEESLKKNLPELSVVSLTQKLTDRRRLRTLIECSLEHFRHQTLS